MGMLLWILLLRAARRGTVIHALAGILVLGLAAGAGSRAPPRLSLLDDAPGGAASPRWVRGLIRSAPIPTPDGGRVLVDVETLRIGGDWLQT
ncbi:MAG: hypothetical protein GWO02_15395, partial [Gammaproteobacteria bacterium]|nr:hypothetical protein [Gammaproteobacteria bacterium]